MSKQCKFWDCFENISPIHTFCGDHFDLLHTGRIDECPICHRGKFTNSLFCNDCDNKSAEPLNSGQTKLATIHLLAAVDDLILMIKTDADTWPTDKKNQLDHLQKKANRVRSELKSI